MFNPGRDDVRRFFCDAWAQRHPGCVPTALQSLAIGWIARHPEYHALLEDPEAALAAEFAVDAGQSNPFLHLSLHLSLLEQIQIDQPPGIRAVWAQLCSRCADEHDAAHRAIEALAITLWEAQRNASPPSNEAYLERLRRAASA